MARVVATDTTSASEAVITSVIHASPLQPVEDQALTLYVMAVFLVLAVPFWFLPGARTVISPLKLFVVGWHELCHMIAAILTGGKVTSVTIDPMLGGCTRVDGGRAGVVLCAGYIGSTLLGACYILAAWDTLAAKIMSFLTIVGMICPLVKVRDKLTFILTFLWLALLVGCFFIDHGGALRWYCMFVGILHIFYAMWDFVDDHLFKKTNDSDCTQFALLYPKTKAHLWAILWIGFEIGLFITFILVGLVVFKRTPEEMQKEAAVFLPT